MQIVKQVYRIVLNYRKVKLDELEEVISVLDMKNLSAQRVSRLLTINRKRGTFKSVVSRYLSPLLWTVCHTPQSAKWPIKIAKRSKLGRDGLIAVFGEWYNRQRLPVKGHTSCRSGFFEKMDHGCYKKRISNKEKKFCTVTITHTRTHVLESDGKSGPITIRICSPSYCLDLAPSNYYLL